MAVVINHPVVRTDLMHGTDVRGELYSFKYMPSNTETMIENGNVVLLGGLIQGEREVYSAGTPAKDSPLKDIVLVASPEVMYDERLKNLDDFYNEAGAICRGYHLHEGDVFSVTAGAINNTKSASAAVAVGDVVELYAGTKLQVPGTTLTSSATQVGKVHAIEMAGRYEYIVIKVGTDPVSD